MPRVCTICAHPQRSAIDAALVAGEPYRSIAQRFAASEAAMFRHKVEHLPRRLAAAHQAAEQADADSLLEQVSALHRRTLSILGQAEVSGELRVALAAIREARGNLELLGKLMGELSEAPQVTIMLSAEWLAVRAALMEALAPYSDARIAAAAALLHLEAQQHAQHGGMHDGHSG
jgi:hypothetical protein